MSNAVHAEITDDMMYNKRNIPFYNIYPKYLFKVDNHSHYGFSLAYIGSDDEKKSISFLEYINHDTCGVTIFSKTNGYFPIKIVIPIKNCNFDPEDATSANGIIAPWHPPRMVLLDNEKVVEPIFSYFHIKDDDNFFEIKKVQNFKWEDNCLAMQIGSEFKCMTKYIHPPKYVYEFNISNKWKCVILSYKDNVNLDIVECYSGNSI